MDKEKHNVRVAKITREAEDINSYEFVDPDGGQLPPFTAGAHLDVWVPNGQLRQFSLCNNPSERHRYVVAVLHERQGRGGSLSFYDDINEGDIVTISAPRNNCQYRRQSQPRCWRKNQPVAVDMRRAPIGALVIFGLNPGSACSLRATLRQSVGLAVHFQNVDVVGQTVEERAGQTFLSERGGPLVERQV